MFEVILLFIGIVAIYLAYKSVKSRNWLRVIIFGFVALFFVAGAATMVSNDDSGSSSSSSSSKSSSSQRETTDQNHRKQAESGVKNINDKIAQDPTLDGLKVKLDKYDTKGEDYDVQVPDSVLDGTNSQQKEIYKNIFTIIAHETGNQDPTVFYYDNAGNQIAETNLDGSIKLDN